jgi:ribosomal protein S18 acetylase RimI-like enzyme
MADEIVPFAPEHLDGALTIFAEERWLSYTQDPQRTLRALTAPGCTTLVALADGEVAGLAQIQGDGEIQAHLTFVTIREGHRRRGLGRRLIAAGLDAAGGERIDLISAADAFYASMTNRRFTGWRLTRRDLGLT